MKQVRETKAGRSISAYIVLRDGKYIATVQFHFGDTGRVQCDIYAPYELVHQRAAGGYGYDKRTAAASGAVIEGYEIDGFTGWEWDRQLEEIGFEVIRAV